MCLPSISMAEKRRKPWNPYKTFENQARGRIAAHIRAVDETHPAFPKPITEKRQNNRPAYAPSTAVSPTVAIHHGDHGTYEPAGTIIIEQHSRQQTTKQTVVRKFRFRQTETTEAMTRMKHIQRSKPAIIGRHDSIQWNGISQDCNLRRTQQQEQSPTWRRHAPTRTCNPTRWNPMQGSHLLS